MKQVLVESGKHLAWEPFVFYTFKYKGVTYQGKIKEVGRVHKHFLNEQVLVRALPQNLQQNTIEYSPAEEVQLRRLHHHMIVITLLLALSVPLLIIAVEVVAVRRANTAQAAI